MRHNFTTLSHMPRLYTGGIIRSFKQTQHSNTERYDEMKKINSIIRTFSILLCIILLFNTGFVSAQGTDETTEPDAVESIGEDAIEAEAEVEAEPVIEHDDYEVIRTDENEIAGLRTPNSKTYRIDDENMQTVIYTEDIHYLDASAGYKEIDNSIVASTSQYGNTLYRLTNEANAYSAYFADENEDELVRINYGGKSISITPVAEEPITDAPINAPIETPIDAPIETPVEAPIEAPIETPVEEPIEAPIETPVEAPIEEEDTTTEISDIQSEEPAAANMENVSTDETEASEEPTEAASTDSTADVVTEDSTELTLEPIEEAVTAKILSSSLADYAVFTESPSLQQLIYPENSVLYEDILPNIDILYETDNYKLKEYIVIKEPTTQNEFLFDYSLYGLTVFTDEAGNISFRDETGEDIFLIGDLFAVDNAGAMTESVTCTVVSTNSGTARLKVTLDAEYLADPERAFPVVIDPSTLICGSKVTLDTYISAAATGTNYYTSDYLKTGFAASGKEQWSLMKFELYTDATASTITSAKIRLEKHSGTSPSSLYARRITSSWSSSSVTYATKPSVSTSTSASNRSAKGVSDGDNWYSLSVTTMVKNMLNGTANYGWKIYDSGLTGTQSTSYYSSDYISPHRPELVINYSTTSTADYGDRAYESSTGSGQNCMGYALDVNEYIGPSILFSSPYATTSDQSAFNQVDSIEDGLIIIERLSLRYMNENIGGDNYEILNAYNSSINNGRYRAVLRFGIKERDGSPGYIIKYNDDPNLPLYDDWDYHWWYQTNTGQWAEKKSSGSSQRIDGTNGTTNPGSSSNLSKWSGDSVNYTSTCKYYAIRSN